jgi:hypothetical protein
MRIGRQSIGDLPMTQEEFYQRRKISNGSVLMAQSSQMTDEKMSSQNESSLGCPFSPPFNLIESVNKHLFKDTADHHLLVDRRRLEDSQF